MWLYAFILAAPRTGVVTADIHYGLPLAGTSHFLGVCKLKMGAQGVPLSSRSTP